MSSVITAAPRTSEQEDQVSKINRETTCPFLLRVFVCTNNHHRPDDFEKSLPSKDEFQMYTWQNATLRELATLIKSVHSAVDKDTRFSFKRVVYERRGVSFANIGLVVLSRKGQDDNKTLWDLDFHIGDFLDVAIYPSSRPSGRTW